MYSVFTSPVKLSAEAKNLFNRKRKESKHWFPLSAFPFTLSIATEQRNRSSLMFSFNICTVCLLVCSILLLINLTNCNRTINICFYKYTACAALLLIICVFYLIIPPRHKYFIPYSSVTCRITLCALKPLCFWSFLIWTDATVRAILKLWVANEPWNYLQCPY